MNIAIIRLYRSENLSGKFYNLQEVGLAKALTENSADHVSVILLSSNKEGIERTKIDDKIDCYIMPANGFGHHGRLDCKILEKLSINVVHLQGDNMYYAPKVIAYCQKHKIMCHSYIGTLYTDSNQPIKRLIMKRISKQNIKWYQRIKNYAKTPFVMEQLQSAGVREVQLAPVGLDLSVIPVINEDREELQRELGLPVGKKLLIFVGRFEEYKHPMDAVKVMEHLNDEFRLIMIGNGTLTKTIQNSVDELGLKEKVTIIKQVENQKIHRYYKACDFFLNFNPDEIYGMALLEAMYQSMTVMAIHAPGPDYIIRDKETGFLFNSMEEMSEMIAKLKKSNDKTIGEAAHRAILENFQWSKTAGIIRYW